MKEAKHAHPHQPVPIDRQPLHLSILPELRAAAGQNNQHDVVTLTRLLNRTFVPRQQIKELVRDLRLIEPGKPISLPILDAADRLESTLAEMNK